MTEINGRIDKDSWKKSSYFENVCVTQMVGFDHCTRREWLINLIDNLQELAHLNME